MLYCKLHFLPFTLQIHYIKQWYWDSKFKPGNHMCNRQYSADFVSSFSFKSDSSPKNDPLLLLKYFVGGTRKSGISCQRDIKTKKSLIHFIHPFFLHFSWNCGASRFLGKRVLNCEAQDRWTFKKRSARFRPNFGQLNLTQVHFFSSPCTRLDFKVTRILAKYLEKMPPKWMWWQWKFRVWIGGLLELWSLGGDTYLKISC